MGLPYGDPDQLDRLAKVVEGHAAAIRQATTDQLAAAGRARWVSDSAQDYRDLLDAKCREADRAASGLEAAAAVLRTHARQVRQLLAAIDRIERAVTEWFSAVGRKLESLVESGQSGPVAPPWLDWPYHPGSIPPPGDRRWLDVGRFMRSVGVM